MMSFACIAVGGNLGDVPAAIRSAQEELACQPGIEQVCCSRLYRTAPIGSQAGDVFVNAAFACQTSLSPEELLEVCQQIERSSGRERLIHWGPRTLDLDLIGYGRLMLNTPRLVLPHPAAWYRRFVLDPVCDVAADWVHPDRQVTIRQLKQRLERRPLVFRFSGQIARESTLVESLRGAFAEELLLVQTEDLDRAGLYGESSGESAPTWELIDDLREPTRWEQAGRVSRLSASHWENLSGQNLIDVVRSALDVPLCEEE